MPNVKENKLVTENVTINSNAYFNYAKFIARIIEKYKSILLKK